MSIVVQNIARGSEALQSSRERVIRELRYLFRKTTIARLGVAAIGSPYELLMQHGILRKAEKIFEKLGLTREIET
eukprot:830618-Amorphochlora_amoeboformis.AAC.1